MPLVSMMLSDFDYELPRGLVAQEALPVRTDARLLVLNRAERAASHRTFRQIPDCFERGDVLVLNDTKVLAARLFGKKKTGGKVEFLVLECGNGACRALIKPSGRVRAGEEIVLNDGETRVRVLDAPHPDSGVRRIEFETDEPVQLLLERIGRIPLPPYIDREDHPADRELYQTVFARVPGAVASPTAGLHFDGALLGALGERGVEILYVTLHVSYGTFQPVVNEDLSAHQMYEEYFDVPEETAERINFAKVDGRRIIACGTTVVRTLETIGEQLVSPSLRGVSPETERRSNLSAEIASASPRNDAKFSGTTRLFIYPPYEFKIVDGMITNFHLPRTTLLMLTSAFAGHELLMRAYHEAVKARYRFYSYGDAMLII